MSGTFEARWRAEMREHGIPEDEITELWHAGRQAGLKARIATPLEAALESCHGGAAAGPDDRSTELMEGE